MVSVEFRKDGLYAEYKELMYICTNVEGEKNILFTSFDVA